VSPVEQAPCGELSRCASVGYPLSPCLALLRMLPNVIRFALIAIWNSPLSELTSFRRAQGCS
jgi:hypothetical protein